MKNQNEIDLVLSFKMSDQWHHGLFEFIDKFLALKNLQDKNNVKIKFCKILWRPY